MKISNFDFNCDLNPLILWQYLDAEKLKGIIAGQQQFMDDNVGGFFTDFNRDVLNIETANSFGLGVWGMLLGVPRPSAPAMVLKHFDAYYSSSAGYAYLDKPLDEVVVNDAPYVYDAETETMSPSGYIDEVHSSWFGWRRTNGWSMMGRASSSYDKDVYVQEGTQPFTDEQYRLLLRARIYLLTFDGSARALNEFFHILFPDLVVTITDNGDMTADISILNEVDPEIAVLFQSPYVEIFLPRPSGVAYNMATGATDYTKVFGFEGMTDSDGNSVAGFDNGTFYQG
ncbi:MAG: DUF2612 domain-containing protein [Neisseriaceae bacterium]|nr:DUF2612 domain-containing protein [Neisseriaceae bacterium]